MITILPSIDHPPFYLLIPFVVGFFFLLSSLSLALHWHGFDVCICGSEGGRK